MIDVTTNKPLRVSTDGTAGPYIEVAVSQLNEIQRLLDSHGIRYWVDEQAISWEGGPYTTDINFGRAGDARAIQAILDSAP
jgi:hypothetical protein